MKELEKKTEMDTPNDIYCSISVFPEDVSSFPRGI